MNITSTMIRQWGDEARERGEPQSADHLHQAAFVVARLNLELRDLRMIIAQMTHDKITEKEARNSP